MADTNEKEVNVKDLCQALAKTLRERVAAYEKDLLELRKKELAKAEPKAKVEQEPHNLCKVCKASICKCAKKSEPSPNKKSSLPTGKSKVVKAPGSGGDIKENKLGKTALKEKDLDEKPVEAPVQKALPHLGGKDQMSRDMTQAASASAPKPQAPAPAPKAVPSNSSALRNELVLKEEPKEVKKADVSAPKPPTGGALKPPPVPAPTGALPKPKLPKIPKAKAPTVPAAAQAPGAAPADKKPV